jgi:hypothetical protein
MPKDWVFFIPVAQQMSKDARTINMLSSMFVFFVESYPFAHQYEIP